MNHSKKYVENEFSQKSRIILNLKSKSFPTYYTLQVIRFEKCGRIIAGPTDLTEF